MIYGIYLHSVELNGELSMILKKKDDVLRDILEKATIDPGYRPDFYKTLLNSDIYFLSDGDSGLSRGEIILKSDKTVSIIIWKKHDGTPIVPIFTSEVELVKGINKKENYIRINAKTLFEGNSNLWYVINPFSDHGKELTPSEIKSLVDGTLLEVGNSLVEIKKDAKILMGQPAIYPNTLVKNLSIYFSRHAEVNSAYLAQIHNSMDENPHLLIAIDGRGDITKIFSELSLVIQPIIESHEYVDLMQLGKSNDLDGYFEGIEPFYRSK